MEKQHDLAIAWELKGEKRVRDKAKALRIYNRMECGIFNGYEEYKVRRAWEKKMRCGLKYIESESGID